MRRHLAIFQFLVLLHSSSSTATPSGIDSHPDSNFSENPRTNFRSLSAQLHENAKSGPGPVVFGTLHTLENLTRWASYEEEYLVPDLEKRLELLEVEMGLIKEYLEDYRNSAGEALRNTHEPKVTPEERGEVISSSAVLSHRMISRYDSSVRKLKEILKSSEYTENQENINGSLEYSEVKVTYNVSSTANGSSQIVELILPVVWPSSKDMYMSSISFLNMQQVYGFLPKHLGIGPTFDSTSSGELTTTQCAEIGLFALERGYYYMAIQWLEFAVILNTEDNKTPEQFLSSILHLAVQENNFQVDFLVNVEKVAVELGVEAVGNFDFSKTFQNLYINPLELRTPENRRLTGRGLEYSTAKGSGISLGKDYSTMQTSFIDLCRGIPFQNIKTQSSLKCHYENRRHPYLFINPVKAEQLSESPPIFQFYEMLGKTEITRIRRMAQFGLHISNVYKQTDFKHFSQFRSSVGGGVHHTLLKNAINLAESVTELSIFGKSGDTQYLEYSYGRYYTFHSDWYVDKSEDGNRVATILYYLEMPTLGGLTPFCNAGISAHPVRGSAVLWFNMYRNGSARSDVYHGSCPVIHGHKIALNHWIRYTGNWRNYKCSLNQLQ